MLVFGFEHDEKEIINSWESVDLLFFVLIDCKILVIQNVVNIEPFKNSSTDPTLRVFDLVFHE